MTRSLQGMMSKVVTVGLIAAVCLALLAGVTAETSQHLRAGAPEDVAVVEAVDVEEAER